MNARSVADAPGLLPFSHECAALGPLFAGEAPSLAALRNSGMPCGAFLASFAALEPVRKRAERQGVLVLYAEAHGLLAALLFQERCYAWLELPFGGNFSPAKNAGAFLDWLLPALDDFRLGWLPQEKVRGLGGVVYRAEELPAEAEGFMPLFAAGGQVHVLSGHGRLLDDAALAGLRAESRVE